MVATSTLAGKVFRRKISMISPSVLGGAASGRAWSPGTTSIFTVDPASRSGMVSGIRSLYSGPLYGRSNTSR